MALVAAHEISKTIRRGIKRAAEFGGRVYNDIDGTSGGHFLPDHCVSVQRPVRQPPIFPLCFNKLS